MRSTNQLDRDQPEFRAGESVSAGAFGRGINCARQECAGRLAFASTGTRTSTHLAAALFAMMADVKFTAVPYKCVAPAITDLLGGQVALMCCPMASVVGQVRGDNLGALGVT
jgi:tripartite-type tricarboxylate transporter receptor subunit TctC